MCYKRILREILNSIANTHIGFIYSFGVFVGILTFGVGQILAFFYWSGIVWVLMQVFIMYSNSDTMHSTTGFINDT